MKFYLSSYKLGNDPQRFSQLVGENGAVGYIPNALDHLTGRDEWMKAHIQEDVAGLKDIGLMPEILDLKEYFGRQDGLQAELGHLDGVWISGGNVFILRQAMRLSGFDQIIRAFDENSQFVYGGYSAACCVLSESLKPYQIGSDPHAQAYETVEDVLWEGLGIIDFAFMPHYDSDHSESDKIDREIEYCRANGIPFKAVSDGEVLIL